MNKIQSFITSLIEYDKALHFMVGFFIFIISSLFLSDLLSVGIVFIFALGKEIRDQITYGGFDFKDLLFTMVAPLILFMLNLL